MNLPNNVGALRTRAAKIKLLLTDVDGVLTDGGVYYSDQGEAMKRFHIPDGMGVVRLRELAGIETGIITGEKSESVRRRAERLKIEELHLGANPKAPLVAAIAKRRGLQLFELAYLGDDVNDLGAMALVGFTACPRDGFSQVRDVVHYVCQKEGGRGAFREVAEFLIAAQKGELDASAPATFSAGK